MSGSVVWNVAQRRWEHATFGACCEECERTGGSCNRDVQRMGAVPKGTRLDPPGQPTSGIIGSPCSVNGQSGTIDPQGYCVSDGLAGPNDMTTLTAALAPKVIISATLGGVLYGAIGGAVGGGKGKRLAGAGWGALAGGIAGAVLGTAVVAIQPLVSK